MGRVGDHCSYFRGVYCLLDLYSVLRACGRVWWVFALSDVFATRTQPLALALTGGVRLVDTSWVPANVLLLPQGVLQSFLLGSSELL